MRNINNLNKIVTKIKNIDNLQNIVNFLSTKHNNEEFTELIENFGFINKWLFAKPYNYARSRPIKTSKKILLFADYTFGIAAIANGPRFEQDLYGELTGTDSKYLTIGSAIFNEILYVGGGSTVINKEETNPFLYYTPLIFYSAVCATRIFLAIKNNKGYQDVSPKRIIMNIPSNYQIEQLNQKPKYSQK